MKLLIKNGRLVDPSQQLDEIMDILVINGKVAKIEKNISQDEDTNLFDAKDKVVMPGLVDVHVHLREPGQEAKEDLISGTKSAAAGGLTTIACMANTNPVIDNAILVSGLKYKIQNEAIVNVEIIGAVTKSLAGKELAEIGDMSKAGAMAFSDDGYFVTSAKLFRNALGYASMFDKIIIVHAEDDTLRCEAHMNEGVTSMRLGLIGNPSVGEDIAVARDLMLAQDVGAKIHIAHVSTKGAVSLIREAKKNGVKVTAEASVHHLTLTDSMVEGYNTAAKVAPPLRTQEHIDALVEGLKDGTIDTIITDHAPHAFEEKDVDFCCAPNGFTGLETSVGVILTELYHTGKLSLLEIANLMSTNPAKIFNLNAGSLKVGSTADITILDLDKKWIVDRSKFYSRGKYTPFENKHCRGKAFATIIAGNIVMKDGVVL